MRLNVLFNYCVIVYLFALLVLQSCSKINYQYYVVSRILINFKHIQIYIDNNLFNIHQINHILLFSQITHKNVFEIIFTNVEELTQ